jgi:hypothetical protein
LLSVSENKLKLEQCYTSKAVAAVRREQAPGKHYNQEQFLLKKHDTVDPSEFKVTRE